MSGELNKLIEIFKEMDEMCSDLIPKILEERSALINLKFDQLKQIAADKGDITNRLMNRKAQCRNLLDRISTGLTGQNLPTVDHLLPHLPPNWRNALSGSYGEFKKRAEELERKNSANRFLAEEGEKTSEEMIEFLVGAINPKVTYDRPGQVYKRNCSPARKIVREM